MSFNQPILNEMLTRETLEYRARDLERAHRIRQARRTAPAKPRTKRRGFSRLVPAARKPA